MPSDATIDVLSGAPLPAAWRLVFPDVDGLRSGDPLYERLADLADGGPKALPLDRLREWSGDQEQAWFEGVLDDGRRLTGRLSILGTHDGDDFMWSDANPSMLATVTGPATALRGALPTELAELGRVDRLDIQSRDVLVLLALAAETWPCDVVLLAPSGGAQIAILLSEVQFTAVADEGAPPAPGLFSRMFRPKPAPPTVEQQLADLRVTIAQAMNQWQRDLLPNAALRALEPGIAHARERLAAGDADAAIPLLAELRARLGRFPTDQEPGGCLLFYEGVAAARTGDRDGAHAAFTQAAKAIVPVSGLLLRLARARTADEPDRSFFLKTAYIGSPDRFVAMATPEEASIVAAALEAAAGKRDADTAEAVLHRVIAELANIERAAAAADAVAAEERTAPNVLCPADHAAERARNSAYADLLLTWATPDRSPGMGSWSDSPSYAPELIRSIRRIEETDTSAVFEVTFTYSWGEHLYPVNYSLSRKAVPLRETAEWRLDSIVEVSEALRMF